VKLTRIFSALALTALFCSSLLALTINSTANAEGFSVKEYEDFHHVLHELQHEALPKKDYARIRSKAGELVKLGEAIVQLGVPAGTAAANVAEFQKELKKFSAALTSFSGDAKTGSDEQLTVSYSAVHESFETLADLLPRKP
jgi:hypothetical protein